MHSRRYQYILHEYPLSCLDKDLYMSEFLQVAIETIYVAIQTIVYTLLLYSMIGFQWTISKFLLFYYFIFTSFIYFTLFGMMFIALTPGLQVGAIVSSFFHSLWNLFSGFLLSRMVSQHSPMHSFSRFYPPKKMLV